MEIYNNKFYGFFGKEGDAYRHAIGIHLANQFQISPKMKFIKGSVFKDVDREVQMAKISSEICGGDENTVYENFGRCYGENYGDGSGLYRDIGKIIFRFFLRKVSDYFS